MPKLPKIELDYATLVAYLDGQLSAKEVMAVEALLAQNHEAQDVVEQLKQCPVELLRGASSTDLTQYLSPEVLDWIQQRQPSTSPSRPPMLLDIASHQLLYARESLSEYNPTPNEIRTLEVELGQQLGLRLQLPDLEQFELSFKRGRHLLAESSPFVELVYLPREGPPIVICLFATEEADHGLTRERADGVNLVYWSLDGIGYAIISKADGCLLYDVANHMARQPKRPSST